MAPFFVALAIILSAAGYLATIPTVCIPDVGCFEKVGSYVRDKRT